MKMLANFPLKYLIPVLFFLMAVFVSYFLYFFNIQNEIRELEFREINSMQKNMMLYQGRINFSIKNREDIKREIAYIFSEREISGVFILDENLKIALSHDSKTNGEDIQVHLQSEITQKIKNLILENKSNVFLNDNNIIYAIFPLIIGDDEESIKRNKKGALIVSKDISTLKEYLHKEESKKILVPIAVYFLSISIITALLYFHFISRLNTILDSIKEFSKGKYKKPITYGNDEIQYLSRELNFMMLIIQEQKSNLQESINLLNQYKQVVDLSSIVSKTDTKGKIIYVNDKFSQVIGYSREEIIGKSHTIIRHPSTPLHLIKSIWDTLNDKKIWIGLIKDRKKDGSSFISKTTIVPILEPNGDIKEYIALRDDVTELIQNKERLKRVFHTDSLTSLSNRFEMINDISKSYSPALALFNIDSFKMLNDYFGCQFGDLILIEFAKRLENHFSTIGAKCYRFHADEFAVLKSIHSNFLNDFLVDVRHFIEEIEQNGLMIDDKKQDIRVTSGVAFDSKDILIEADLALKSAKLQKKNLVIYDSTIKKNTNYEDTIKWSKKIKRAIETDNIKPFFQAIYDNHIDSIQKYEALVRLIDEDGKVISPFFFLDISKKVRLYTKIMEIMVVKTFETFKDNKFSFSINLTVEDIFNSDFIEFLFTKVKYYNIADRLIFELVESEGIENFEEVNRFIQKSKEYGCKIAIDDFGTGYSNFEYLLKIDTQFIKIDGSMIKNIDTDQNSKDVVKTIVDFAKARNIQTIAEFVSSKEIFEQVKTLNIDFSQGYFIAEPKEKI